MIHKPCNKIFSIGKKFNIMYYAAPPHHRITPGTFFYFVHTSRSYENDFIEGRCRFFFIESRFVLMIVSKPSRRLDH